MSFKGKTVIVTGSSSGIGAGTTILFAKNGADVVIVDRNEENMKNVAIKCEEVGNKPLLIKADVGKEEDAQRIIKETIDKYSKLDILVNNAGIAGLESFFKEDYMKVYDEVMNINLRSIVRLSHLAAPYLIKSKGNIINVSSIASKHCLPTDSIYCTSKAGLDHFSRCVAAELAPNGVRVNTVNPGPVLTDIFNTYNSGKTTEMVNMFWKMIKDITALMRISDVEEIGELILFLASDKDRGVTGSSFVSDNGTLVK